MAGLSQNLRTLRTRAGLTQAEVAARLDPPYTPAAVTMWEGGRSKPRLDALRQLAGMFEVTASELMGEDALPPEGAAVPRGSSRLVPLVATIHMGAPDPDEGAERMLQVPEGVVENHPDCYLVHGHGRCMNRRYPEDAALLVDPHRPPRNGDAVYARGPLGGVVRTYYAGRSTLMLCADSWSDEYEDIVVGPEDEAVEVLGTVVWYQAMEDLR